MDNLTIFQGYHEKYKGTLVIDYCYNVVLMRGMRLDLEDDYYYDLLKWGKKKSTLYSAVGRIIFLKDHLPKDDYDSLVSVWNLNNEEKAI